VRKPAAAVALPSANTAPSRSSALLVRVTCWDHCFPRLPAAGRLVRVLAGEPSPPRRGTAVMFTSYPWRSLSRMKPDWDRFPSSLERSEFLLGR
jgi:hypothetical protein